MSGPAQPSDLHVPAHPVRFVTAAALFDGHDAAINIMRRILQAQGAEVIHLGHDRSVREVVDAVLEEDAQGVAISSYQGGHVEYFKYLVDRLRAEGRPDVKVYGGGGGVIVAAEIEELEAYGVQRIFSPADGQRLGLERMINVLIEECDHDLTVDGPPSLDALRGGDRRALARPWRRVVGLLGVTPDDGICPKARVVGTLALGTLPPRGSTGKGCPSLAHGPVACQPVSHHDPAISHCELWS